jgi:hypothetical protein
VNDETSLVFEGFRLLRAIDPDTLDFPGVGLLECFPYSGIEVDEFNIRKNLQDLPMLDNAIGGQTFDQHVGYRIRYWRYQSHTECHEPYRNAVEHHEAAFEAADAGIADHQIAIRGHLRSANLEHPAGLGGILQRGQQIIHHVSDRNRLGFVVQPYRTRHDGQQFGHETDHLKRNASRACYDSHAQFGDGNLSGAQDFASLDARTHVRGYMFLRVGEPAEENDMGNARLPRRGGEGAG